jgi:hypothetical protein
VIENRVLRRIFGPKWNEVTGECRKLHKEGLSDLYSSSNFFCDKIEKNKMGGVCSTYEGEERCLKGLGLET